MNEDKLKLYRKSFKYFLYDVRANTHNLSFYSGSLISSTSLISEENYHNYFYLSSLIESDEKLILINGQERQMGVSTFLSFYSYYKTIFLKSDIFFVTDAKGYKLYTSSIHEIAAILKRFTEVVPIINPQTREIQVPKTKSTIRFLSDVTYTFTSYTSKIDYIIFDNADLKNYDKLAYLLEGIVNNLTANKVILNFNHYTPGKENLVERLRDDFIGKILVINNLKNKA